MNRRDSARLSSSCRLWSSWTYYPAPAYLQPDVPLETLGVLDDDSGNFVRIDQDAARADLRADDDQI